MIRLYVEAYCHNCPNFEPAVEKLDCGYCDTVLNETVVKCEHHDRCANQMEYFRLEIVRGKKTDEKDN